MSPDAVFSTLPELYCIRLLFQLVCGSLFFQFCLHYLKRIFYWVEIMWLTWPLNSIPFFALRNSWEYFFIVDCDNITPTSLRVFVIWLGINNGNDSVIMHFCCLLWCFSLSRFSSLSLMCSFCLERKISPLYQPVHAVTQNGMKIKGSMNEHQLSPDAFLAVFCAGITLSSACLMYSSHPTLAPTPMLQ